MVKILASSKKFSRRVLMQELDFDCSDAPRLFASFEAWAVAGFHLDSRILPTTSCVMVKEWLEGLTVADQNIVICWLKNNGFITIDDEKMSEPFIVELDPGCFRIRVKTGDGETWALGDITKDGFRPMSCVGRGTGIALDRKDAIVILPYN